MVVKWPLFKGLEQNPNAIPTVALPCTTSQDTASGLFSWTSFEDYKMVRIF